MDVNASAWDCALEEGALRLGFRLMDGFQEGWAERLTVARDAGFTNMAELEALGLPKAALEASGRGGCAGQPDDEPPARLCGM